MPDEGLRWHGNVAAQEAILSAIVPGVMAKQYRSKALAAVHETALGLYEAGVVDKRTMREFGVMCLTQVKARLSRATHGTRLRKKAGHES